MYLDILGCDNGQQRFDDLELNSLVGLWPHEAVADG